MPYKDQTKCYQTINGVKYVNQFDVVDPEHAYLVQKAKDLGLRMKLVSHPDGFKQLFLHPNDETKFLAIILI